MLKLSNSALVQEQQCRHVLECALEQGLESRGEAAQDFTMSWLIYLGLIIFISEMWKLILPSTSDELAVKLF